MENKLTCDDLMKAHDEGYVKGLKARYESILNKVEDALAKEHLLNIRVKKVLDKLKEEVNKK